MSALGSKELSALGSGVPWPSFPWKKGVNQCKSIHTTNQRRLQTSTIEENGGLRSLGSNVYFTRANLITFHALYDFIFLISFFLN